MGDETVLKSSMYEKVDQDVEIGPSVLHDVWEVSRRAAFNGIEGCSKPLKTYDFYISLFLFCSVTVPLYFTISKIPRPTCCGLNNKIRPSCYNVAGS